MSKMNSEETIKYLDKIDAAYAQGKLGGWSRYSKKWSEFSTPMNVEIRKKIEAGHPEKLFMKMILSYWINRSVMLEMYFKRKNKIRKNKLRALSHSCKAIRKDIVSGCANENEMLTLNDIARMSLKGA